MNRPLTALFAALEALLVVGVGVGLPLVPLTLMWAFQYGLQLDWVVFWRGAVDAWLLGHGADVRFTLDSAIAAATGIPAAGESFVITIAPLGFAVITLLFAVRAGRRIIETPHRVIGTIVAIVAFGLLATAVTITSLDVLARPSIVQGALLPTAVFALGLLIGSAMGLAKVGRSLEVGTDDTRLGAVRRLAGTAPRLLRAASAALTGGAAAAMIVVAVSSIVLAVLIGLDYGEIIGLYEGVQSSYLGGAALTIGQLAILPNLVVFTASWLIGPGFAIGAGSAVTPLGTALGPLPAVPVLGALPTVDSPFAFAGILVPVLAGFIVATILRGRLVRSGVSSIGALVGCGLGIGIAGGVLLGALAWISGGAAGPGRLVEVGPSWLLVGAWSALEIGLPAVIALLVGGIRRHREVDDATGPVVVQEPARV